MHLDRVCPFDHTIEAPILVVVNVLSLGRRALVLRDARLQSPIRASGGWRGSNQALCVGCLLPPQSLQGGFVPHRFIEALVLDSVRAMMRT